MEMNHFVMTECASAPLADIRQREEQSPKSRNHRKNTTEELRRKHSRRNKKQKQAFKALSKKTRQMQMAEKIYARRLNAEKTTFEQRLVDIERLREKERRKTLYFWRMWKQEKTIQRSQR